MYRPKLCEQETTIVWDEETKQASIYTASPVTMRKLDKLCAECPDVYANTWADISGTAKRYTVNARYVRFGKPPTEARKECGRKLSERRKINKVY